MPRFLFTLALCLLACESPPALSRDAAPATRDGGEDAASGAPDASGEDAGTPPDAGDAAAADPRADGVTGTLADGEVVTIAWDGEHGFGDLGPEVLVFDRFEGTPGNEIPLESPDVGLWSGAGGNPALFSEETARSGSTAMLAYDGESGAMRQLRLRFEPRDELFLSFWVALPEGSRFPGRDHLPSGFSMDSSWKFTWVFDGSDGYGHDGRYDQCLPTHTGRGAFAIGGNDGNWSWLSNDWFGWSTWTRITVRGRPGAEPSVDDGEGFFQAVSALGHHRRELDDRPMYQGGTERFDRLNVPGWIRTGGDGAVRPHYDDVYFAAGPGAAARVELGDAEDYASCTNLVMAIPLRWTDTELEVRLHGNRDMETFEGAWIHVHDADDRAVGAPRAIR